MNIEKLNPEIIFKDYKYGRFNLLDNDFNFVETNTQLIVRNYYDYKPYAGECGQLLEDYIEDSDDIIYRAVGQETSFFNNERSRHYFGLDFGDFLPDKVYSGLIDHIEYIKSVNPIVIDPTFKRIGKLSELKYVVNRLCIYDVGPVGDLKMKKWDDTIEPTPLGFINSDNHLEFGLDNNVPIIIIRNKKNPFDPVNINLTNRNKWENELSRNEEMKQIVINLYNKYNERELVDYK